MTLPNMVIQYSLCDGSGSRFEEDPVLSLMDPDGAGFATHLMLRTGCNYGGRCMPNMVIRYSLCYRSGSKFEKDLVQSLMDPDLQLP